MLPSHDSYESLRALDAPLGRATALRGKLAALEGDCVTANRLFDRADAEGGPGCAPLKDRMLCAAPQK